MRSIIPLNIPTLLGNELQFITDSYSFEGHAEPAYFVDRCEELLSDYFNSATMVTSSCTAALELAAMLISRKGAYVVMPTFTFSSTANAFMRAGMRPKFVDCRFDTYNMDENEVSQVVDHNTAAIVPVHYAGVACDMDSIMTTSRRWGVPVVEDNAHGIFGSYNGKKLGAIGHLGALSFHETKNFQCGEGGALIVNNGDWDLAERIRDKGTTRAAMIRGDADKYTWTALGSSFTMSEMSAAYLLAQLENREYVRLARRSIENGYSLGLRAWCERTESRMQTVPSNCESSNHIFSLLLPSEKTRDALIDHLRLQGIGAAFHYVPLHLSPMGQSLGYKTGQFPVAEQIASKLVRLPIYPSLTCSQQLFIIQAIEESGI